MPSNTPSFISLVATDLISRYGSDLSRTVVVFPNKRASLFLNEELVRVVEKQSNDGKAAIWSPRYITISELFRRNSQLVIADRIKLVSELYKVFTQITGSDESIDSFYSWGELLISDFDDVDKNMADASMVFENTSDLHSYDGVSYLSDQQKTALKEFFKNFTDDHDKILKQKFEQLWNRLGTIYQTYRETLRSQGIAYEGMLYRDVVELCEQGELPPFTSDEAERYVFVGFNLLQQVEKKIFNVIKAEGDSTAHFYWDYDEYYLEGNEAGKYILKHLEQYPNDLPERALFQNFNKPKKITYINASTDDIQARYVTQWLTPERIKAGRKTAIVMCDENLLPTIINCIPPEVTSVNVTTGYPLQNTPTVELIQKVFTLHNVANATHDGKFRLHHVNNLLRHPYMQQISPLSSEVMKCLNEGHIFFPSIDDVAADENLRRVFTISDDREKSDIELNLEIADKLMWMLKTTAMNSSPKPLMQETIFRTYTLISRIRSLIESDNIGFTTQTFLRLILEAVKTTSVPFHGEPIEGIQVMGVLETRNLDFDHVLLLSCNEGNMPKGVNDSSFIPHTIRSAHGLTTVENKVGIYAYYFYRLLQRASDVEIAYNSSTDDGQMKEKSRFLQQLLAESPLAIELRSFSTALTPMTRSCQEIAKTAPVMHILNGIKSMSPTAINTYLRCPLRFFYTYVCNIRQEDDEVEETELDSRIFGLIFHDAAEELYKPFLNQIMTPEIFKDLAKKDYKIDTAIDTAIKKRLFRFPEDKAAEMPMPRLGGNEVLQRNIIRRLILQLLRFDQKQTKGIEIRGTELPVNYSIDLSDRSLRIKGTIDRLDVITTPENGRQMRIVDYKTGTASQPALSSLDDVFNPEKIEKHSDYYLQTILYGITQLSQAAVAGASRGPIPVSPCLIYPSHAFKDGYDPTLTFGSSRSIAPITDISTIADEFMTNLKSLLTEIFSQDVPFRPTPVADRCKNCYCRPFCGR